MTNLQVTLFDSASNVMSQLPDGRSIIFFSGYAIANYGTTEPAGTGWVHQTIEFLVGGKWFSINEADVVPSVSLSAIDNTKTDDSPQMGWAVDNCLADILDHQIRLTCPLSLIADFDSNAFTTPDNSNILRLDYCVTAVGQVTKPTPPKLQIDKSIINHILECAYNIPNITIKDSSTDDGNGPQNVLDTGVNSLNTRWSSFGIGAHITLDLGSLELICRVEIAWYNGDQRKYHFRIATSPDNFGFTDKFNGDSSGSTLIPEKYSIPFTNARYVRITVNGYTKPDNTTNEWAAITNIDVFGP